MAGALDRLFSPKSIAVFGSGWAENVIHQCLRSGYRGDIWPVHPTRSELGGRPCFADVEHLPAAPDAAFIAVNRHDTIAIVKSLSKLDAGGAVCFASGFREAAHEDPQSGDLEAQLVEAAGSMPILGPNCYGFINYLDRIPLWPDQHGGKTLDRGVALITQSSNLVLSLTMQRRGLPVAFVATVGNQAQTSLAQIAENLLHDDRITAVGLYIEGIGDLRDFEQMAAAARQLKKPIVALKAGKSETAQSLAVSHTASLAGSDAGADALFYRLGIARVHSVGAFLESLKFLHSVGPLPGNALASLSCSGGEANLMADAIIGRNLIYPPLIPKQEKALQSALGDRVHLANPLDYHTYIWGDRAALTTAFCAMLQGDQDVTALVLDLPREDQCDPVDWQPTLDAFIDAKNSTSCPCVIISTLPENLPEDWSKKLLAQGIVPLWTIEDGLSAIETAAQLGARVLDNPLPLLQAAPTIEVARSQTLDEAQAKTLLYKAGVPIPAATTVSMKSDIINTARNISYPIVLKSLGQAHKTEMGGIILDIANDRDLEKAVEAIPSSENGYLIEEQITGTIAELLIAVHRDPAHGFVLTLAAGGTLTEIWQDSCHLLLPTTREEILNGLKSLRIWPVLEGYRGKPPVCLEAIFATVENVTNYVADNVTQIEEIEINPFILLPDCGIAVDALIRIRLPAAESERP